MIFSEKRPLFLGILLLAAAGSLLHWTQRLDLKLLDLQFGVLRALAPPSLAPEVVIVGIDEETLRQFPEPLALWHGHLARFLHAMVLAGPSAVGVDVLLPERSYDAFMPGVDQTLLRAIIQARRALPVVFAITVDSAGRPSGILPSFAAAAGEAGLGYALFPVDGDGVVRRFTEQLVDGESVTPTLTGQMLRRLNARSGGGYIDFTQGEPFGYIPLQRVLAWESSQDLAALKRAFAGKPVMLGFIVPFTDRQLAPAPLMAAEPDSANVPGVALHAQTLRNALGGGLIAQVPAAVSLLLCAAAAALWFVSLRAAYALLLWFALAAALLAASTWLLRSGWLLPVVIPIIIASVTLLGRAGFEAMRERWRLRSSFSGYVSPQIMEEILAGRLTHGLSGSRVRICLMFSDIRGFTSRSEGDTPEGVINLLNRYFEEMTAAIHGGGGTIDKFMGDGIMAFFGAPKPLENPCKQAFAAACDMLERLAALNRALAAEGVAPITIGVGLHVGDAIVGHVGSRSRHEYTAIGDVVNVASRVEGLSKDAGYPLICTREVVDAVGGDVGFVPLGSKPVKGHTPVEVFGWPSAGKP